MALKKKPAYTAKTSAFTLKGSRKLNVSTGARLPQMKTSNTQLVELKKQSSTTDTATVINAPTSILVLEYRFEDWLTGNTIYCLARAKQWEIHFVSFHYKSSFRFMPGIKSYSHFPKEASEDSFLEFLKQVVQKTKAALLVPATSAGFQFVLRHKEALEQFINIIPLPKPWAYDIVNDKGHLAEYMFQNDIPGPLTIFDLTEDLEKKLDGFPFPVLLKPKTGSGGKGATGEPPISLFTDKETLLACIQQYGIADRYVVQSFVEGYEIDCNVLYKEGKLIACSIQKALVKTGPYLPSSGLEFIQNEQAIAIVDSLLTKLQWNGVAHIDLIYDCKAQQLQVLEINPRFWQTVVASLVGAQINFPSLACLQGLNQPIERVTSQTGKYISLIPYLKYQLEGNTGKKVPFGWRAIDMRYFFALLPARLYRLYRQLTQKKFNKSINAVQASIMLWCPYMLYKKAHFSLMLVANCKEVTEEVISYCSLIS